MRVKLILKSLSVSLDKGETTCMFLLVTVYSLLIAEVVGYAGHFRKWTAFNFCFQLQRNKDEMYEQVRGVDNRQVG